RTAPAVARTQGGTPERHHGFRAEVTSLVRTARAACAGSAAAGGATPVVPCPAGERHDRRSSGSGAAGPEHVLTLDDLHALTALRLAQRLLRGVELVPALPG